jgi:hypothetical protein
MKSIFDTDLTEIREDLTKMIKGWFNLLLNPKEAPPTVRSPELAFVTLYSFTIEDEEKVKDQPMGVFVPELYELAKLGGLRCQLEKDIKDKTFQTKPPTITLMQDKCEKTPFELAVLPVAYSDDDEKSYRVIQKVVEEEFNYRIKNNLALPSVSYKYQIKSDYLKGIEKIGLMVDKPRHIKLNLLNPPERTKLLERSLHWIAQRLALFLTIAAAILIIPKIPMAYVAPAYAGTIIAVAVLGIIIAEWCGKDFSTYSLAETLLREINGFSLKSFRARSVSLKKLIKTTLLLSALLLSGAAAGAGAWFTFMGFHWIVPESVLLAKALMASKYFLATTFALMTGLSTLIGGLVAQSFFWGVGIWNNQIDFDKEQRLAPLDQRKMLSPEQRTWKNQTFLEKLRSENRNQPQKIEAITFAFARLEKNAGSDVAPSERSKSQGLSLN